MNKLKQAIISTIHGLPLEEAELIESNITKSEEEFLKKNYGYMTTITHPITLSRVLEALYQEGWEAHDISDSCNLTNNKISITLYHRHEDYDMGGYNFMLEWKLLKEDKSTATLEDQSEETIIELTKIFI